MSNFINLEGRKSDELVGDKYAIKYGYEVLQKKPLLVLNLIRVGINRVCQALLVTVHCLTD